MDGEIVAEETVPSVTDEWKKYNVTLTSPVTANRNVKLQLLIDNGAVDIDFVSMFPQGTYKGRQVVSTDDTGDIIVKLVNEKDAEKTFAIDIQNAGKLTGAADVEIAAADSITADNKLGKPEVVTLKTSSAEGVSDKFNYTVSPLSVTVLRIHRG